MNSTILVIGSSNTDMVIQSPTLPAAGETVIGGDFLMNPGGKGANQAVAAAKLGGTVKFIAKVGDDIFGTQAIEGFQAAKIDTQYISRDLESPSGVALILVDNKGENCISVALGANGNLSPADLDKAGAAFDKADYLLIQLEIPIETVEHAAQKALNSGTKLILNPAPAQILTDELLQKIYILTPNETEAHILTGIEVIDEDTAQQAASILRAKGVEIVIITLGAQGAYVSAEGIERIIAAPKVEAVDTTAAGDTFNGALVVGLAEGRRLQEAVSFANRAAAISVTRLGAQQSCPSRQEL